MLLRAAVWSSNAAGGSAVRFDRHRRRTGPNNGVSGQSINDEKQLWKRNHKKDRRQERNAALRTLVAATLALW